MADVNQYDFWFFQAKDIATALVATASLVVSFTTLRIAYLRKADIKIQPGNQFDIYMGMDGSIHIVSEIVILNKGAEAGMIDDLLLYMVRINSNKFFLKNKRTKFTYKWREFRTVIDRNSESDLDKFGIGKHYKFSAFANALIVPKNDGVNKIIQFAPFMSSSIQAGEYEIILEGVLLNSRRNILSGRRPRFRSYKRHIYISQDNINWIEERKAKIKNGKFEGASHNTFFLSGKAYIKMK